MQGRTRRAPAAFLTGALLLGGGASAQTPAGEGEIAVELNKLEAAGPTCRGYFVVRNATAATLQDLRLDVFLFDTTGVIQRRVALGFRDVRPERSRIVLFDLAPGGCETFGRLVVNEVIACADPAGAPVPGCADKLRPTSRASATFGF
jgi:hypothetical protein